MTDWALKIYSMLVGILRGAVVLPYAARDFFFYDTPMYIHGDMHDVFALQRRTNDSPARRKWLHGSSGDCCATSSSIMNVSG